MNERSNPEMRDNERACPECGAAVNVAATLCVHCGAPLTPLTTPGSSPQPARSGTGLDPKVAAALSYVFTFITGIIFLLIEKDDEYVRFHAGQAVVFGVAVFVAFIAANIITAILGFILSFIPMVGALAALLIGLIWLAMWLGALALWLVLMFKAYQGERFSLPVLGGLAQKVTASMAR
jgi:uncharacterized membrane protein